MIPRAQVNAYTVGDADMPPLEMESLAALAALAQRTRLSIFRMLVEQEPKGMAAGEVAQRVGAPQNTVSAHLGVLARADLVVSARQSRNIIYRANLSRMHSLIQYLVSNCCQGNQTCAITSLVPFCADGSCDCKTPAHDSKTTPKG